MRIDFRKRSLYSRLLIVFNSIMFVALVMITTVFITARQSMNNQEQRETMEKEVSFLVEMTKQRNNGEMSEKAYLMFVTQYMDGNTEIWLIRRGLMADSVMRISGDSSDEAIAAEISFVDELVKNSINTVINDGAVVTSSNFSKHFNLPTYTVAMPVSSTSVFGGNSGAIYMHRRIQPVSMDMLNSLLSSIALMTLAVSLIPIVFITRNMTKPLREMAIASERYAKGDFSRRIQPSKIREVDMLSDSLNSMAENLAQLDSLRMGFVANVSHELRSPLTSMQGYVQALLDGTIADEDKDKYLGVVLDETKRLTRLVSDLLDLSKIEGGHMPIHMVRFDICELIRRVLIKYDNRIEEKNLEVDVLFRPDQSFVEADPDRIEQVLSNLVDNAIKFLPEGGTLTLLSNQSISTVFVTVKDNGPGIAEEDQPFIFERFYKADKAHTSGGGTGLGLSIASKIIDSHGYKLTCTSVQGEGTSFDFELKRWIEPETK